MGTYSLTPPLSPPQVSQAAEDIFSLLAPALPNESTLLLLIPMAAKEKYPILLGVIKFLTKVRDMGVALHDFK